MVLCFGNYSDCGSCLFVCSLGKGKWKLCGTEGSVYTCLGRGPGNQLSETQYITGYMELYNLVELFVIYIAFGIGYEWGRKYSRVEGKEPEKIKKANRLFDVLCCCWLCRPDVL